jgi:hypothetical protein
MLQYGSTTGAIPQSKLARDRVNQSMWSELAGIDEIVTQAIGT